MSRHAARSDDHYLFVLFVFRIANKRTLSEATAFDLVLLLIVSETTQQAMVDDDHSMTNAAILICTLVGADMLLSFAKQAISGARSGARWVRSHSVP